MGDHIRRRRLALKMLQKEVAEQIGVEKTSVFNWEANTASPEIRYMPAIIQFLGYNPLPEAKGWGERLVLHRMSLGLSQKQAAVRLGVDPGTLARWERGERMPAGVLAARAERFVGTEATSSAGCRPDSVILAGDGSQAVLTARAIILQLTARGPCALDFRSEQVCKHSERYGENKSEDVHFEARRLKRIRKLRAELKRLLEAGPTEGKNTDRPANLENESVLLSIPSWRAWQKRYFLDSQRGDVLPIPLTAGAPSFIEFTCSSSSQYWRAGVILAGSDYDPTSNRIIDALLIHLAIDVHARRASVTVWESGLRTHDVDIGSPQSKYRFRLDLTRHQDAVQILVNNESTMDLRVHEKQRWSRQLFLAAWADTSDYDVSFEQIAVR